MSRLRRPAEETSTTRKSARVAETRQAILVAAERLFAERGLDNVSHRQISAAAGQGNVAAVNYHFGSTTDLVRAIVGVHAEAIEQLRLNRLATVHGSTNLRDWVGCLVHPAAQHLESLGSPTWYARFNAQVTTEPRYRASLVAEMMGSAALRQTVDGLQACLVDVPEAVRAERGDMARLLSVHIFAERETALAEGLPTPRASWSECADGLVDATVGLWLAPTRSAGRPHVPLRP